MRGLIHKMEESHVSPSRAPYEYTPVSTWGYVYTYTGLRMHTDYRKKKSICHIMVFFFQSRLRAGSCYVRSNGPIFHYLTLRLRVYIGAVYID